MVSPLLNLIAASVLGAVDGAAAAPVQGGDPAALSSGFWSDWQTVKSSERFTTLKKAVDCGCTGNGASAPPPAGGQHQTIVSMAIDKPADAAKFLGDAVRSSTGPETDNAIATVIAMRIPAATLEAAQSQIPADVRARVETWKANLSTGIEGLPGIYLGDNAEANRPAVPQGYEPVAGGSFGCPGR